MEFCVELTLSVQDCNEGLATRVPLEMQLFYRGGRWQAQCMDPPLITEFAETMEEALKCAARYAARELAAH